MAFQDIVALLQTEGEEKAAELLSAAEEKSAALLEVSKQAIQDFSVEQDALLESQKASMKKKTDTALLQKGRSVTAQMQQSVLDAAFNELQEKITNSSDEDMQKILTSLVSLITEEKGEVVALGNTSEKVLKKAVQESKKKFSVSSDTKSDKGGFVFIGEGFTMDFSFQSFVETQIRPKYASQVFKKLFS